MRKKCPKGNKLILQYVQNNIKEITTISIIFIIGIIFGIMLINNIKEERKNRINNIHKSICRKY